MSDEPLKPGKARMPRHSNKIIPRGGKQREKRQLQVLSPVQVRVLNAMFDPNHRTRADLAKATGVNEITIGRWMMDSPAFLDEYRRRIERGGDDIVELNLAALKLAWAFYIEVLSDRTGKYTSDDKHKAAKAVLDVNRPRIDAMNFNQINVGSQPAPPNPGAGVIPSVQRLQATGLDERAATMADARELALVLDQLGTGAITVIDGEYTEGGGHGENGG